MSVCVVHCTAIITTKFSPGHYAYLHNDGNCDDDDDDDDDVDDNDSSGAAGGGQTNDAFVM